MMRRFSSEPSVIFEGRRHPPVPITTPTPQTQTDAVLLIQMDLWQEILKTTSVHMETKKNDRTGQLGSLCLGTPSTSYLVNTFIIFVYSNTCHFVIIPSIHVTVGCCYCSVVKSCLTLCDPHGLQHTRLPCPSQSPSLPNFRSIELVMPSLKVLLLLFYMYAFLYSGLKIWPPTIYLYSSSLNMFEL